ncbi:DUF3817 domain-containing protein [Elizabethkingia ursingii]|uniref:DUF3817 domain-containing protein n=1 Tax=Elizabethkingia ursingii TaxID=1756150 RepID=A0AAJ3NE47_9FLAO|nr:DUF3817 domain-containing protein [Elizabethkingia ursingii]AQX08484.1 hypothetical protein BBD34_07475 [Elizabethkingia ursingii]OPB78049.1 hypothetical protein BAY32_03840 [Elizabethkingia ursingii]
MEFINRYFSKYPEETIIKWFKNTCIAEAVSCFLLYCIAMVWKRYDPDGLLSTIFIIVVGNIHGLFFTLYLLLCLPSRKIYNWDDEDFVFALLAALFPFATIWVDKSLAKKNREE